LPTPLEACPRLGDALGGPAIYVKRDDATGLAGGGNKARKLEYLCADAMAKGANMLVTTGGSQSNHARMTAAVAAKLGMACRLYLKGNEPAVLRGNLLLDELLGAELVFCGTMDYPEIYKLIEEDTPALNKKGFSPYLVPMGGSSPLGALGYARMIVEELHPLCQERGIEPASLVVASGSGGTMAGILLGLALCNWQVPLQGYSVSYTVRHLQQHVADLYQEAAGLVGYDGGITPEEVLVDAGYIGPGYGVATPGALEALDLFARKEGLLLDSVYTAKAAAGMMADIRNGRWGKEDTLIFIHTGGYPALFAKDDVEAWLKGGSEL
jgi:D-cysteine desulfhydrase family pyridoxal phosphate-dependent enzyme